MKSLYLILAILLFLCYPLKAEERFHERVYIHNDKDCYITGEDMWLKFYLFDNNFQASGLSKVGYVEISDTGTGMDADTLAQCFDPMFSTKQARALGMSLTVSKQIVTMHGGAIKAESSLGRGSKFIINLPLSA